MIPHIFRRRRGHEQTGITASLPLYAAVETAAVARAPLFTKLFAVSGAVALLAFAPNLLISTLGGQAEAAPFNQTWPVPAAQVRQAPDFIGQNLLGTTLTAQAVAPFNPVDWPNPRLRSHVDGTVSLGLQQSTLAPQEQVPFTPAAWANPSIRRSPEGTFTGNLLQSTLTLEAGTPFAPVVWELPRYGIRVYTVYARPGRMEEVVAAGTPVTQPEWPNPRIARRALALYTWTASPAVPVGEVPPFARSEFTNPQVARRSIALLTHTTSPAAAPSATPEIRAFDWALPARARPSQTSTSLGGVLFDSAGEPFLSKDWPNPTRLKRAVSLLTHTASPAVPIGEVPPYAKPLAWVVPPAPRRASELRTWTQNLLQNTLEPAPPAGGEVNYVVFARRLFRR